MLPPGKDQRSYRGFTLMELLVATAIIGALVAIAMPQFGRMREQSMGMKCQTNLRNIAAGGLLYAADRNGQLPDRTLWGSLTGAAGSLRPYLNLPVKESGLTVLDHDSVLTCPSIQASRFRTDDEGRRTYSINQYATGSDDGSANARTTWENQVKSRDVPIRVGNAKQAASQAFFLEGTLLAEAGGYRYSVYQAPDRLEAAEEEDSTSWRTPYIHQGRVNVVFLDGHIESISLERARAELIGPTNPSVSQAHTSPRTRPFWGAQK